MAFPDDGGALVMVAQLTTAKRLVILLFNLDIIFILRKGRINPIEAEWKSMSNRQEG